MGLFGNLFGGKGKTAKKKVVKVNIDRRFTLHNRIGQGSMSKVWRASDSKTGKTVCLKVLDKRKLDALLKRFVGMKRPDEGEIAMTLNHPNIVRTFEHGVTTNDEQFLVMELVEGPGLNFLIETRSPAIVGKELDYLIQAGESIAHFHEKGYIHRDICPRNILVTNEGVVKLIDFGLAVPNTPEFRRPGNRTGTASYMAPELIKREQTDERIDVFSFGVTVFQTFTNNLPWEAGESLQSMLQHINSPGHDPREFNPKLSDDVAKVIMKGIERRPADRYRTMRDFINELRRLKGE